jgi:hypothetical protein
MNIKEYITNLYKDPRIDTYIDNITRIDNYDLKDDLKQELFIILLNYKEEKIKDAIKNFYIDYLIINILMKMYRSNTSPFSITYKKHLQKTTELINDVPQETNIEEPPTIDVMKYVNELKLFDREALKMYYKMGNYNMIDGIYKDKTCKSSISSYRKIANKLRFNNIYISHTIIGMSIVKSISYIKKRIKEDDKRN